MIHQCYCGITSCIRAARWIALRSRLKFAITLLWWARAWWRRWWWCQLSCHTPPPPPPARLAVRSQETRNTPPANIRRPRKCSRPLIAFQHDSIDFYSAQHFIFHNLAEVYDTLQKRNYPPQAHCLHFKGAQRADQYLPIRRAAPCVPFVHLSAPLLH